MNKNTKPLTKKIEEAKKNKPLTTTIKLNTMTKKVDAKIKNLKLTVIN